MNKTANKIGPRRTGNRRRQSLALPFFLLFSGIGLLLPSPAQAEFPATSIKKDIQEIHQLKQNPNPSQTEYIQLLQQLEFKKNRSIRYRSIDLSTLESLSIGEASSLFKLLPQAPSIRRWESTKIDLYKNDIPHVSPFDLDLRVSSKITLEGKTKFFDALVIGQPLQKRLSLSIQKQLTKATLIQGFFDPISQEILGILSHQIHSNSSIGLIFYRDPQENRHEVLANLIFHF